MAFEKISDILREISTDDNKNLVVGMVRVGWIAGAAVYLFGGVSMVAVMLRIAWSQHTAADYQAFGIGFAAWAAGMSTYTISGSTALWVQAKADALPATVTTSTTETPLTKETVTTETPISKAD